VLDLDSTVDTFADVVIPRTYWGENKVTGRPKGQDSMRMITEWMMEGINTITIPVLAQYPDTIVSPYICRTTTRSDKNCSTGVSAAAAADATRIDVSKMEQWNIILDWAEINGMVVEFQLEDSSTQYFLDGGNMTLGPERKLLYREMTSRFGDYLGLIWKISDGSNNNSSIDDERIVNERISYLAAVDPYQHPIVG
jgi:hypothetical protein